MFINDQMDGNIFVQLSYAKFNMSPELLRDIENRLGHVVRPFVMAKFNLLCRLHVRLFDVPTSDRVQVFIMDKITHTERANELVTYVKAFLITKIENLLPEMIDVKINYAAFAPDFQPENSAANAVYDLLSSSKPEKTDGMKIAEFDYEKLSLNYKAVEPQYTFDQVILSEKTREVIMRAISLIDPEIQHKVFDEWGLREIIPNPSSALNFYGPPGTGKSMAAEAIAHKLGKKILRATYADIESKYHGEGPKMVKAIFMAAEREDAILFIDESDSLLSKRSTNLNESSAQVENSMRSQLLISLEQFKGIVIFATNLVINYDKAFLSRLISVKFTMPDAKDREKIWENHLKHGKVNIPTEGVSYPKLAEEFEVSGREIKNSVQDACVERLRKVKETREKRAEVVKALQEKVAAPDKLDELKTELARAEAEAQEELPEAVTQLDLIEATKLTIEKRKEVLSASDDTDSRSKPRVTGANLDSEQEDILINAAQSTMDKKDAEKAQVQEKEQEKEKEKVPGKEPPVSEPEAK